VIIHTPTKSIVLDGTNQTVLSFITRARSLEFKGRPLTVVPHDLDETLVMRNLGYDVPSPILHYFDWTGPFKPYSHQRETAAFLTVNRRAFVFSGLGSGKTYSAIEAAEYMMQTGHVKRVLILCCLSTVTPTWGNELFTHVMNRSVRYLTGTADRRLKHLAAEADYYVMNHDGLRTDRLCKAIAARDDIDLIIVDEASLYRNARSQRYKALQSIIGQRRMWLMTATPCPKDPTDAWALARLVDPKRVPSHFVQWRDMVMRQITQFKWVAKPEGQQLAFNAMQPAIRFRTEDCIDLPERVFMMRRAALSDEQAAAYSAMRNYMAAEMEGTVISAANAGVALMKLVQIACGAVRTGEDDEVLEFGNVPRLDTLAEVLAEVEPEAKIIIFAPFKALLPMIANALNLLGMTTAIVSGATPKKERDQIFTDFQHGANPRVLVAHPACMSHGLTLTAANTTIWYAPLTNSETVEQANARTYRNGQKRTTRVIELYSTPEEKRLYDIVKGRHEQSTSLMDLYRQVVEGVDLE
jgi:SNF2 family DNA or RNA helicase